MCTSVMQAFGVLCTDSQPACTRNGLAIGTNMVMVGPNIDPCVCKSPLSSVYEFSSLSSTHSLPRIELIGEETYDEFDSEGQSRLSHHISQLSRKDSRHESPVIPSEVAPVSTTTGPHSQQAVSPTVSFSSELTPTKTPSLRPSLIALVS